jgi:hypothetical protein
MKSWLERCPAWQFALACGGLMSLAVIVGGAAGQWLRHGHFDFSYLLAGAAGTMLVSLIAALGYRAIKSRDR